MKKRGFTLVELLAVIAILAVILIVAVPKVNNYIMSSRKESFINNALNIARQLEYDNMDFITFDKAYIKDFELEKLNRNDIDINNSLVYVENNEIYIDLVGIGSYEGFYVCHVNSDSKNVTIQNTECGTSPDGLIYIDFEVNLDGGESTQKYNNQYASGNYLNLIPPKKYDLTFAGWEVLNGNSIISGNRIRFGTEATTIKALWKQNSTLTLDLNGGTTTQTFEKKYSGGTSIILKVPTREGYAFIGWEVVSGNSILSGNTLTIGSEDTVIKANWQIDKVNIRYNLDGGTAGASAPTEGKSGSTVTVSKPSKTGYTFAGWTVSGTGASIDDTSLTIGTSDITLTANWTINTYIITYELDGGTFENEMPTQAEYGSTIILENPIKEGYTFIGLTASGNNAILSGNSLTIGDGDVTLTANWVKTITEFAYTGGEQTFAVPVSGYYKVELWGAQGGYATDCSNLARAAYTSGTIHLIKNEKLYVYIGQSGFATASAGFNGAGSGGLGNSYGNSGGGATDIRYLYNDLASRIMVAAGGGGTGGHLGYNSAGEGSHAGGLIGYSGGYYSGHSYVNQNGKGGTQVSGGTAGNNIYSATGTVNSGVFGIGGDNFSVSSNVGAGGGGGGYYGGGAGGGTQTGGTGNGAGGGSSYISGHTGCVSIESSSSTAARTGTNDASCTTGTSDNLCSIHYSGMTFTDTVMIDGAGYVWTNAKGSLQQMPNPSGGYYDSGIGHSGNGYAKITFIGKTLSE